MVSRYGCIYRTRSNSHRAVTRARKRDAMPDYLLEMIAISCIFWLSDRFGDRLSTNKPLLMRYQASFSMTMQVGNILTYPHSFSSQFGAICHYQTGPGTNIVVNWLRKPFRYYWLCYELPSSFELCLKSIMGLYL
jgi:hypothetical protein